MAYSGVMNDVLRCVRREKPARLPAFACSEEFDVRVIGQIYSDYNSNAKIMAGTQIAAVERFDYDWAWLQVDDCIEFEPLGVGVKGSGNILPATCNYLPAKWETLRSLKMPDCRKDGRLPVLLEAITRVKQRFGESLCVVGRIPAPFSAVTLLYGITESMLLLYDEPELFDRTADFLCEYVTAYGLAQLEAGADALWVGDCNASGHLISADFFARHAAAQVRRCAEALHRAGGLTIYHASEYMPGHLALMVETGVSAVNVGPGIDIADAKAVTDRLQKGCIAGNVDPIETLLYGTPEQVRADTLRILDAGTRSPGYLPNSGEMVPRDVPEENMRAMLDTIREYRL